MKQLIIMRHGEAEAFAETDSARLLTEPGKTGVRTNTQRLIAELAPAGQFAPLIFHSPYVRTTQTAGLLFELLVNSNMVSGEIRPQPVDELIGNQTVSGVIDWLSSVKSAQVILVSHQPLVSCLVSWLVDGSEQRGVNAQYSMAPASIAALEIDQELPGRGTATLRAMLHV